MGRGEGRGEGGGGGEGGSLVVNGLVTCDLQSTTTTTTMARSPNMTMGEVVHSLPLRAAPPPHTQPKPKAPASRAAGMWATSSPSLPRVGPLGNLKSQPPAWLAAGQRQVPASHPWLSYFFCPALPALPTTRAAPPPPQAQPQPQPKVPVSRMAGFWAKASRGGFLGNANSQPRAWLASGQDHQQRNHQWTNTHTTTKTESPSLPQGGPLGNSLARRASGQRKVLS